MPYKYRPVKNFIFEQTDKKDYLCRLITLKTFVLMVTKFLNNRDLKALNKN